MKIKLLLGTACLTIIFLSGCGDNENTPMVEGPASTWEVIQSQIFETNCVVCHTDGTSFARQSNLVLTKEAGYNNLVDRVPNNAAAAADGLMLLETNGLERLFSSFLWEKVNAPDQEHFYGDHPEYGEIMPLGLPPLTNGELEYIRAWIIAGAPETGFVADERLLENTTRFEVPDEIFEALPQPESGVQMHLGPFEVQPNFERELFEFQIVGNTEDIFVNRIEITLRKGSHHFIFYDFDPGTFPPPVNEVRDVRDENNRFIISTLETMADHVFVFGSQLRNTDYSYPEGVALKIQAGKGFDLNTHYTNYGEETIIGELYTNLHTIDESEVQHLARQLFLNEDEFSLPPLQESTVIADYTFNETRNIFLLTSHAHQHMKEFRISIIGGPRDGELVYFTNDWEHPELLEYDPPIILNSGEGLRGEALYDNDTDKTLRFGLLSVEEMMIIFGSYYTD